MAGGLHEDVKASIQNALYHNSTYTAGNVMYAALSGGTYVGSSSNFDDSSPALWSNYARVALFVGTADDTMGAPSGANGLVQNTKVIQFPACEDASTFTIQSAYLTVTPTTGSSAYIVGADLTEGSITINQYNVATFGVDNITLQISNLL